MLILLKLTFVQATEEEKKQIEKISAFLKENKHPYMLQANQGDYEVNDIGLGNVIAEIDAINELEQFVIFLRDLGVERHQICIVDQVAFVRGDGKRLYDYFPFNMSLNHFTSEFLGK